MTDIEKNEEMFDQDLDMTELELAALEEISGGKGKQKFLKTTGQVNVRKGAGLKYATVGVLAKGTIVSYLGASKKDDRGVAWYKINFNGNEGWISSKYSKFI